MDKTNWSEALKRFHANLNQVNDELDKITPEVRARCEEQDTTAGNKIVFQHSFACDGDILFIAVEGNTSTKQINLTHFKWVEHNEEG